MSARTTAAKNNISSKKAARWAAPALGPETPSIRRMPP